MRGGQRQAGVFGQRIYGLHQALAERGLAQDQAAVVILQRAGDDLGRRSREVVDQHHDGIIAPAVAVARLIDFFRRRTAAVRNDHLALLQEFVGHGDALVQQAAGISAQIEHQTFDIVLAQPAQVVPRSLLVVSLKPSTQM